MLKEKANKKEEEEKLTNMADKSGQYEQKIS